MWKKGFLLFFFSIHNAELIWINLIALWFSDKRENYTALWVWAAGFSPYSTYMYIYCCKHNCIYCYLHNHNWYIFSIPRLFTCNFMCYKFPQVICVFDYTCIRKKRFYSVCVKSNFFYTALSLSKHQVHNSLLQTGIFLQLTFPRIAFNNTPSHSSNFAA